jgi:diguanylate cyclase (GGDEF)-like protein
VTEEGRLVGLLTERDLLATWGASADPITGLPWQDQLRRWAAGSLAAGREIAVLFIDLNQFGLLNKQHGHVTGDRMLKAVAATLKAVVDPEQDTVCRYGGDEFAIATTRTQEEAWRLAEQIRERIQQIDSHLEGVHVAASIGVAGGKRGAPRPEAHPSATLDDLINLASRASTQAKAEAAKIVAARGVLDPAHEIPEPSSSRGAGREAASEPRVMVDACSLQNAGAGAEVTVGLCRGSRVEQAVVPHTGADLMEAFAVAAAEALSRFLPAEHRFTLEELRLLNDPDGACDVAATLRLETPHGGERLIGAVPLLEDRYRSAVNAVLDATNRRLDYLVAGGTPAPLRAVEEGHAQPPEMRVGG